MAQTKTYDRAYFEKWYRDPGHQVIERSSVARKVRMAVSIAEHFLERPIESVLDVGCGEGPWFVHLKGLRPGVRYLGLDPSDYVVKRYGKTRNIRPGSFGQLGELRFDERFDLIVCSDVLHYVEPKELERGLSGLAELLHGVAFLEVFTTEDNPVGDLHGFLKRPAAWYRTRFEDAGLHWCGPHCYMGNDVMRLCSALEIGP